MMPPIRELVQIRLDERLTRDVDHLAVEWGLHRSEAYERLLREALSPYKRAAAQGRAYTGGQP